MKKITFFKPIRGYCRTLNTGAFLLASSLALAISSANAETGNPRVNQLGYLPNGIKIATYKASGGAEQWQLKQNGTLITSGTTTPSQFDPATGDELKQIDISNVTATGNGFTLSVGGNVSYPFSIKSDLYNKALYDALRYFYHNRAGIEIKTQFTGGGNGSYATNSKWARPAGHVGAGANKGDFNVGCWSGVQCNYTLSPVKGWYDAGDHGKYVVNGGISAWTLLNMFERQKFIAPQSNNLNDGQLNIPESGNGVADILDEARWEVEFMLAMQVPTNQPKSGMAHHKLHDVGWGDLPLRPDLDAKERKLVQPTTTATLNLAAVAAQAARIWKTIDPAFANQCLTAATRAWDAAKANPNDIYNADTFKTDNGGGGYGDNKVGDEFYWAAAELYLTTGDSKYLSTLNNYTLTNNDFGWADTAFAGVISLATVNASQTATLQADAKQKVISAANAHLITQNASGYSSPLAATINDHDWGSNSFVMNRAIIMGLAYDFAKDEKYSQGVSKSMDYLFGRNYFSTSYVTGLGTKTMQAPHHRFWANSKDSSYPTPPPGSISGGPNAKVFVGTPEGAPGGCESRPATCWRDGIGAFATNEITINWNSPFAWLLNWQKDHTDSTSTSSSSSSSSSSSTPSSTPSLNPPAAPSNLMVEIIEGIIPSNSKMVGLSWQDNSGANGDAETGFRIYVNTVNTKPASATQTTPTNARSTGIAGLSPLTTYYFWVEAFNDRGASASVTNNATTSGGTTLGSPLSNGDFNTGTAGWNCSLPQGSATCSVVAGEYVVNISNGGSLGWHIQPKQDNISLIQGKTYTFAFDARASANRNAEIKVERSVSPWEDFTNTGSGQSLTTKMQRFKYTFTMNTSLNNARIAMNLGGSNSSVYIDNIVLVEGNLDPCGGKVGCTLSSTSSSSTSSSSSSSSSSTTSETPAPSITIQAESYSSIQNMQTETTQDTGGGLNVGYTDAGDWMTYAAVNLPCSGTYTVEYRIAGTSEGSLQLEKAGGTPIFGKITVPSTGGWQTWKTISHDITLPAGNMNFGIAVIKGGWNLNWLRLTPKCNVVTSSSSSSSSSSSKSSSSNRTSSSSIGPEWYCNGNWQFTPCSSSSSSSTSSTTDRNRYNAPKTSVAPVIDGMAENAWDKAAWAPMDVFWLGNIPNAQDFSGRYKAMWDAGNLYLLVDITDDVLLDATVNPLERYWDDDSVEIFIDENKNGGLHETNTSAWAYHVSTLGDTVDLTNGTTAKKLNDHITVRRVSVGSKHMWEMSIRVYGETYNDNTANTPVALFAGKLMGFSAAYNDNDASSQRESMMGSVDTQGHKDNRGYIDASVFGSMQLIDSNVSSSSNSSVSTIPTTIIAQAEDYARASDLTPGNAGGVYRQGDVDIEATTDVGGGYNVGWIEIGESLSIDTNLISGASYSVYARVASKNGGGTFNFQAGRNQPIFTEVPNTGDWQTWQTIKVGEVFAFADGISNGANISIVNGGFNLNWIKLVPTCASTPGCVDSDQDGVPDSVDQCPNTPLSTQVDEKGCVPSVAITAKAASQAMGKGFNIGQMFESTQHAPTFASAKAKIDAYYAKGFRNVRIPITWTENVQGSKLVNDANVGDVNLNHPRLAVIKQVVDYALTKPGLYVVINAHHEGGIKNGNKSAVLERLWQDISGIFADRDYRLMYEFLNEPHLDTPNSDQKPPMDPANLRNMTGKAYAKVRAQDPKRIVIIGGNQWFAAHEMAITWPNLDAVGGGQDKYIMAEFHHYNPWTFNGDNQGDYSDNWADSDVSGPMDTMTSWANSVGQGMPVYIGEWGSGWGSRYATMQCNNIRLFYQKLGSQYAPAKGQPTAVWDDGGWFKVFDHSTNNFANNLVECIGGSCTWDGTERFNTGCK